MKNAFFHNLLILRQSSPLHNLVCPPIHQAAPLTQHIAVVIDGRYAARPMVKLSFDGLARPQARIIGARRKHVTDTVYRLVHIPPHPGQHTIDYA